LSGSRARRGLQADRARLERVRSELADVLDGRGAETLNWRPAPNRWSVGEVALHVATVNTGYLDRVETVVARERARGRTGSEPFRYGRFARWFLAQMEPANTRRLPAPKVFRPRRREVTEGIGAELDATLARLDRALERAEGLDLARAKVATPVTPLLRFPLGIVLRMLVAHTERHLRQMEWVLASPGCPGASGDAPGKERGRESAPRRTEGVGT